MEPSKTAHRASLRDELGLRALVLGVSFVVTGWFSNQFVFPPHPSAVLWLPSGLSLAFLLRTPPQGWPVLLAAIFLADFVSVHLHGFPIPLWTSALWGLANCLRPLVGAWLIRRFVGTDLRLTRRWELAGLLLFGGVVGPLVSATIGSLGYTFSSEPSSFLADWANWWLSDGLGTILVAPLLLTWTPPASRPKRFRLGVELGVMLALTALGAHFIFGHPEPEGLRASLVYISFFFILWGALRRGPLGAASTSVVVAAIAVWHTLLGRGPFASLAASQPEKLFTLQVFLAILGLTALTLAAVVSERWRTEELQRLLVETGTVLAASLDVRETFPRVGHLVVPRTCAGFAVWLVGENGLLERVAQAGWSPAREARLRGHLPPLPTTSRRWCTREGTVVLAPLWVRDQVQGVLVLMSDERAHCAEVAERSLAEELAYRCSMALESARLYAEARQAIEARNEFIAVAAHELRTPLTALTLRMQSLHALLRREQASENAREKVRATSRQLERLSQLVERLLDVGRITTGQLELHREEVDVAGLVEQVLDAFDEEATRVGSPLRWEVEPGLTAWWDRGRIEQALINLVTNALKFGAGRPIEVHVSAEGGAVRIAVRDHGIGIAPEALERIFERFERAVSSRRYGGLGLGLFLTRQIAESHGGTIHVESRPGEGSTFELLLPLGQRPGAGEAREHPAPA
ncbi:signal transduction histidine kinase [Archangium gephyra]|uniref:histidine kinase n=1 Tax=Archangium gephyra TaxID=48 RepID=A0AAC8Q4J0_9BACT|nr:MASE1 domain-containing protein [Archangium gephyra]AKJ00757.1 Sensory box histidine kinase [Archangium gephyra]REG25919.1 signal transduction histidine kinase [Archangium gephyra]